MAGGGHEAVPVVEMHVHLEGTISPALARELAGRESGGGMSQPFPWQQPDFRWPGFRAWHRAMQRIGDTCLTSAADYGRIAADYAGRLAAEGVVYAEINVCLRRPRRLGLDPAAVVRAVGDALAGGPPTGMIVALDRTAPPADMMADVELAATLRDEGVVGIDVQGGPGGAAPAAAALARARAYGLGVRVHAGETDGPASVDEALDLGVDRIAHGVRAIESAACLDRLARSGTPLDICPSSNIALRLYPSWEAHPLRRLMDAGVQVTLGSDDPFYFNTSARGEYARAAERLGLDDDALRTISRNALRFSFAPPALRRRLEAGNFDAVATMAVAS